VSSRPHFSPIIERDGISPATHAGEIRSASVAEKLKYDDNIFYLNEIITTIENAIKLEIDSDLYLDKLVEDILFVETTLARLYNSLIENQLLIRRSEHLRRLLRSKQQFCELLERISDGETTIGSNLAPFFPKFQELVSEQRDHIDEIHALLDAHVVATEQSEDMVSQEEFRILMDDSPPEA